MQHFADEDGQLVWALFRGETVVQSGSSPAPLDIDELNRLFGREVISVT